MKNVLPPSCLPTFLLDLINFNSNLRVYTAMQDAKFPHVHLVASGWYLDYSRGFVPEVEGVLYNTTVSSAPKVIELEREPEEDILALLSNKKEFASVKGKGKDKKIVAHAPSQVSTRTFRKAFVQRIVAPTTTVVGSPTATPSALAPHFVADPFHSGAAIPSVPRETKAVAPDTSVTSSERSSSLSLIENVDMGEFIENLMKTKVYPPAYRRIQEFLTKVCVPFYYFIHSFNVVQHLFFLLSLEFCFSGWSWPYLSRYQA
jgi:hypothetical protein